MTETILPIAANERTFSTLPSELSYVKRHKCGLCQKFACGSIILLFGIVIGLLLYTYSPSAVKGVVEYTSQVYESMAIVRTSNFTTAADVPSTPILTTLPLTTTIQPPQQKIFDRLFEWAKLNTELRTPNSFQICPQEWKYFLETGSCYKAFHKRILFEDAVRECHEMDSHLATVHSNEEMQFLMNFEYPLIYTHLEYPYEGGIWIGAKIVENPLDNSSRIVINTDNTPNNYTIFASGEPNNFYVDESCIMFYPTNATGIPEHYVGKWNDMSCGGARSYGLVCKKKASLCLKNSCIESFDDDEILTTTAVEKQRKDSVLDELYQHFF